MNPPPIIVLFLYYCICLPTAVAWQENIGVVMQ